MAKTKKRTTRPPRKSNAMRTRRRRSKADDLVQLTPAGRWEAQQRHLEAWHARVSAAPSMHGETWRAGQLRHIEALLAEHAKAKPQ